ncbi:MAG: hypothetical protein NVS2B9_20770 [Myxococcales bacterium]
MDPTVSEYLNLLFRWIHVVAGILWIGHLWFFNFVNAQVAKTYTPEGKKQVLPELMPRALYWFRWGAAYTWVTGLLLLVLVYFLGGALANDASGMKPHAAGGVGLVAVVIGFAIYDQLWKNMKNEQTGAVISFLLLAVFTFAMSRIMSGRAVFIFVGSLFGTIMAANVWMRIWPSQRRIIAGVKGTGPAPDPSVAALAGLRSKHNTYMSVPLILTMISNHFPGVYGSDLGWVWLLVLVLAGWAATKFLYTKSASPEAAAF